MTARKALEWYSVASDIGVDGMVPACEQCQARLFTPGFAESVYSVSIETGDDPAAMARRDLDAYHARRHQEG